MDRRTLARGQALGRILFGAALVGAPVRAASPWLGSATRLPATKVALAAMGARDLAIGVGTAYAAGAGTGARPWLLASALSDSADFLATMRHRDRLPAFGVVGVGALAAGSAALGAWLALGDA